MKKIDLKMLRDLRNMRGQAIAIAFVIIAGVSVYVTMSSVSDTLQGTLNTYYAVSYTHLTLPTIYSV